MRTTEHGTVLFPSMQPKWSSVVGKSKDREKIRDDLIKNGYVFYGKRIDDSGEIWRVVDVNDAWLCASHVNGPTPVAIDGNAARELHKAYTILHGPTPMYGDPAFEAWFCRRTGGFKLTFRAPYIGLNPEIVSIKFTN